VEAGQEPRLHVQTRAGRGETFEAELADQIGKADELYSRVISLRPNDERLRLVRIRWQAGRKDWKGRRGRFYSMARSG